MSEGAANDEVYYWNFSRQAAGVDLISMYASLNSPVLIVDKFELVVLVGPGTVRWCLPRAEHELGSIRFTA